MSQAQNNSSGKYSKRGFYIAFVVCVFICAGVVHIFHKEDECGIKSNECGQVVVSKQMASSTPTQNGGLITNDTIDSVGMDSVFRIEKKNEVRGVVSFKNDFPDENDVQIVAAQKNGIVPINSRNDITSYLANHQLVYIGASPFYVVDELEHSLPYLTPKTYDLLNTIAINFIDSLISKGMQPHMIMVTSVLRTNDDVHKLRRGNRNSVKNSAHCYGTTVDITYNRFVPIMANKSMPVKIDRWDFKKKQVLSEVLRDLRLQNRCYVKHERRQACFHLTVR
ncbi:MAG: DUF5715 family protein [Bacteroidaceae bacterium]|nr:DUF5715 family protein [Bacteroidaceae bacterium]